MLRNLWWSCSLIWLLYHCFFLGTKEQQTMLLRQMGSQRHPRPTNSTISASQWKLETLNDNKTTGLVKTSTGRALVEHTVSTMLQVISFAVLYKHVFQIGFKLFQLLQAQYIKSILIWQITSSWRWKSDKAKGRHCFRGWTSAFSKTSSSIFCFSWVSYCKGWASDTKESHYFQIQL